MLDHLAEPAEPWISDSGPSWEARPDCDLVADDAPPVRSRPLDRRLSVDQREAIVRAYADGMVQKDLAVQYGISDRSVKRLIANARKSGLKLRARAV
jgi:DNA-directed RNA polymerase specialized sigma24 family protein